MKNKKGFTLIELLVVVLIIGILAAIALPQYQVVVLKSRFATVMQNTRVIKEAQERYYLINGEYATKLNNLDISIQGCDILNSRLVCSKTNTEYQYIATNIEVVGAYDPIPGGAFGRLSYRLFLNNSPYPNYEGCRVSDGYDKLAVKVCSSFGTRNSHQDWTL